MTRCEKGLCYTGRIGHSLSLPMSGQGLMSTLRLLLLCGQLKKMLFPNQHTSFQLLATRPCQYQPTGQSRAAEDSFLICGQAVVKTEPDRDETDCHSYQVPPAWPYQVLQSECDRCQNQLHDGATRYYWKARCKRLEEFAGQG